MVDVSERLTAEPHRAEELLLIERDLSLAVSASSSLIEVLDLLLSAMCLIGGIDCGGVYLVDPSTGALRLVAHTGLSPEFVERSSRYDGGTSQAQRVMASAPIYVLSTNLPATDLDLREREGLRAIAVIPVMLKGEVVAVLNLASRTLDEIPAIEMTVVELAQDMVAKKDVRELPRPDEPALKLDDPDKRQAIESAYAKIAPMFWGPRMSLAEACIAIRSWLGHQWWCQ